MHDLAGQIETARSDPGDSVVQGVTEPQVAPLPARRCAAGHFREQGRFPQARLTEDSEDPGLPLLRMRQKLGNGVHFLLPAYETAGRHRPHPLVARLSHTCPQYAVQPVRARTLAFRKPPTWPKPGNYARRKRPSPGRPEEVSVPALSRAHAAVSVVVGAVGAVLTNLATTRPSWALVAGLVLCVAVGAILAWTSAGPAAPADRPTVRQTVTGDSHIAGGRTLATGDVEIDVAVRDRSRLDNSSTTGSRGRIERKIEDRSTVADHDIESP